MLATSAAGRPVWVSAESYAVLLTTAGPPPSRCARAAQQAQQPAGFYARFAAAGRRRAAPACGKPASCCQLDTFVAFKCQRHSAIQGQGQPALEATRLSLQHLPHMHAQQVALGAASAHLLGAIRHQCGHWRHGGSRRRGGAGGPGGTTGAPRAAARQQLAHAAGGGRRRAAGDWR